MDAIFGKGVGERNPGGHYGGRMGNGRAKWMVIRG